MVGDIVGSGRVGADDAGRHDAQVPFRVAGRGQALVARHRVGGVAVGAGAVVLLAIGTKRERIPAAVSAVVLVALGFGLSYIQWTKPVGERIFVSMLQGNIDQFTKWDPEFRNENIQAYMDLMDPDKYPNVETSHLVIWPETALSDFFQQSTEDVMLPMQQWAKEAKTDVLMGGFF